MESKGIDHLFRHHSGKMVSVLTRIFGLAHLEIIEDAVQDTFIKASLSWRNKQPDNPEAWLTQAAKNRVLDIFRKLKTQKNNLHELQGTHTIAINELFLDTEIEDAQLRMIFTACHSKLDARDRISFALKTVSGFSIKEISAALLTKEDTIKKRLFRAKKTIKEGDLQFYIPQGKELHKRLDTVLEVLYLIFNEGFHSNNKQYLIRTDLCGEAMRLCQLVLKRKDLRTSKVYALFAVMCFHSARLDAKINSNNEILDLKHQDRSKWHFPLIELGNTMMNKAVETEEYSSYHYEAAIAAEHLRATTFEETDWDKIIIWYKSLYAIQPMSIYLLNLAVIHTQNDSYNEANAHLQNLKAEDFEQRAYLYYAVKADYYNAIGLGLDALQNIDKAIEKVTNTLEKTYLENKKASWVLKINN